MIRFANWKQETLIATLEKRGMGAVDHVRDNLGLTFLGGERNSKISARLRPAAPVKLGQRWERSAYEPIPR